MPLGAASRRRMSRLVLSILYLRCVLHAKYQSADVAVRLSILYLRCARAISTCVMFSDYVALSILYLRCACFSAGTTTLQNI